MVLDEMARLYEHAARAARRIENDPMVRFDDVDDGLHDRGRRKELAIVVRALLGKLGEEVFVDASEDVARGGAQRLGIEHAHHSLKKTAVEPLIVPWQLPRERREGRFDRFHGGPSAPRRDCRPSAS